MLKCQMQGGSSHRRAQIERKINLSLSLDTSAAQGGGRGLTVRLAATMDGGEADGGHKDGACADGDKHGPRLGWKTAKQNKFKRIMFVTTIRMRCNGERAGPIHAGH